MNVIKTGTVILQAAFIIIDIKSLVDDWQSEHQSAIVLKEKLEVIEKELQLIKEIKIEINKVESLLETPETLYSLYINFSYLVIIVVIFIFILFFFYLKK